MTKSKLTVEEATELISSGETSGSGDNWIPTHDVDKLDAEGVFELLLGEDFNRDWDTLLSEVVLRYFTTDDIPESVMFRILSTVPKADGDYDYPETYSQLDNWNAWAEFSNTLEDDDLDDLEDWDDIDDEEDYEDDPDRIISRWESEAY
jgi:hypothetical protein